MEGPPKNWFVRLRMLLKADGRYAALVVVVLCIPLTLRFGGDYTGAALSILAIIGVNLSYRR